MNQFNKRVRTNTGNIFNINYEQESSNSNNGGGGGGGTDIAVINNLTTNDPEAALSAAQGVVLKGITDAIQVTADAALSGVETLSGEVTTLNGDVEYLNSELNSVNTRVDTVVGDLNAVYGNLDTIDSEITSLKNRVTPLEAASATHTTQISNLNTSVAVLNGRVNQNVNTNSIPSFAGASFTGNITTTGTIAGRNIATDGSNLDTVVSRVNQDLKSTASPTFVNATIAGTTVSAINTNVNNLLTVVSAQLDQSVKTTSNPKFLSLLLKDGTDTLASGARFIHALDGSMISNDTRYIAFGRTNTAGNQAEFGFTWVGVGAATNSFFLGFHSNRNLEMYYDGRCVINGAAVLKTSAASGVNVEGAMNWNGTTKVPRFYNGTAWSDLATSSAASDTAGKVVGSVDFVMCKSDSNAFGYNYTYNKTGVIDTITGSGDQASITVNLTSDPGNVTCLVMVMGQTSNFPTNVRWLGIRDGSLVYRIAATQSAPVWTNPSDIYGSIVNLYSVFPASGGIHLRVVLFRTP